MGDDLSDEELDSLIGDLEGKEGGSASGSAEDVDMDSLMEEADAGDVDVSTDGPAATDLAEELPEDLPEPDLSDLEDGDQVPAEAESTSAAKSGDEAAGDESPDPEELFGGESGAPEEKSEASKSEPSADKQKKQSGVKDGSGTTGSPDAEGIAWGRWALFGAKWFGYALPIVALVWLVGAYLGQWVRAGWLVGAVAGGFALGVPAILYRLAGERGKFRWWFAGSSLVLVVGLVAPLQKEAGNVLAQYGHWPGVAAEEIAGSGEFVVGVTGRAAGALGGLLASDIAEKQMRVELGAPPSSADGADEGAAKSEEGDGARTTDENEGETADETAGESAPESAAADEETPSSESVSETDETSSEPGGESGEVEGESTGADSEKEGEGAESEETPNETKSEAPGNEGDEGGEKSESASDEAVETEPEENESGAETSGDDEGSSESDETPKEGGSETE